LNTILRTKFDEIDQWKKKVTEREAELSKYKNLENELYNYESKISNLKIENDRINGILKSRLGEIEDWKGRHNVLQATVSNFGNIEKEKQAL
jgi:predicted nuclease with TOPRIM domain